jgi:hypothetical protein
LVPLFAERGIHAASSPIANSELMRAEARAPEANNDSVWRCTVKGTCLDIFEPEYESSTAQ